MLLLIDLDINKEISKFDIGDVLIFEDEYPHTHYLVIFDSISSEYKLLSLITYKSFKGYKSLENLIRDVNDPETTDGQKLVEILKSNEVVLRRVANE